jgi:cysteinyl-tRNA synthetase
MNKDIFLTNNLSNKKEKFVPLNTKKIGMYVCGPTVYDNPHIGNARPLIIFDILFKVLKYKYGESSVNYIRNITDVDDKIIKSAKENKISIQELTSKVIKDFEDDCNFLNLDKPNKEPKATDHIHEMIEMISELIKKKFAYEKNKHVYFEVKKFKDYGKLSNKNLEELISGSRVKVSENKKNPEDFVLWKPSSDNEPYWDSPWGKGRPGWHLECSAMSKKYLGNQFDIHGGGIDLIFPHHENEIAQSRCANDTKIFANYWVHNGFITMSNEKMAKSQGNILSIKQLKDWGAGQVLRLALMSAHYKQPLDWSENLYQASKNIIQKWYDGVDKTDYFPEKNLNQKLLENPIKIPEKILEPLYDDLNTPGYIANLHELFEKMKSGNENDKYIFISACNFVGLLLETKHDWLYQRFKAAHLEIKVINERLKLMDEARENKNYEESDKIRKELNDNGIEIMTKDGKSTVKLK